MDGGQTGAKKIEKGKRGVVRREREGGEGGTEEREKGRRGVDGPCGSTCLHSSATWEED